MRRMLWVVLLLCGTPLSVSAATYYVATNGSDGRSCAVAQTIGTPKLTLNNAVGCLSAGDTLLVRGGNYAESLLDPAMANGTSWSNKVRIAAYPGETVWLKPTGSQIFVIQLDIAQAYLEFDGINTDARGIGAGGSIFIAFHDPFPDQPHHIRIQNAEIIGNTTNYAQWGPSGVELAAKTPVVTGGIELRNLTIHGNGRAGTTNFDNGYGIYLAAPNNLVENNNIYDNKGCEIHAFNDDGALPDNNIIRNNVIHDESRKGQGPASCGIIIAGSNNQIYGNVIYKIRASSTSGDGDGIAIYRGNGNKVWNNTISDNTAGIEVYPGATATSIQNNISYGNTLNYSNSGGGTSPSNNLFGVDPLFVNAAAANFHLQPGSPGINAGVTLSNVTTDIAGTLRPIGAYDIGAYEAGGLAPPSAPTGLRVTP